MTTIATKSLAKVNNFSVEIKLAALHNGLAVWENVYRGGIFLDFDRPAIFGEELQYGNFDESDFLMEILLLLLVGWFFFSLLNVEMIVAGFCL